MEQQQTKQQEKKERKQKPFKLCFLPKREAGRSYVQIERPPNVDAPLAPKFYTKPDVVQTDRLAEYVERLKVTELKQKYEYPITENQEYGWYSLGMDNVHRQDPRLNHARRTGQMVKENLMNFEKIRP